jgi:hypothetical protein
MMDYRVLLMRYIAHVGSCDGVTFMPSDYRWNWETINPPLTEDEIKELINLDEESRQFDRRS